MFIIDMLRRLPDDCIRHTTEAFRARHIVEAKKCKAVQKDFLVSRDARLTNKTKAVESFLSRCHEKMGMLDHKQMDNLQGGKIPRGVVLGIRQRASTITQGLQCSGSCPERKSCIPSSLKAVRQCD